MDLKYLMSMLPLYLVWIKIPHFMQKFCTISNMIIGFLENMLLCLTIFHFVSSYPYRRGTICQWCKIRVQYNVSVYRFYKTLQLLNFPGFVFSKKCMLCIKRKAKEMNVKTFDQSWWNLHQIIKELLANQ